MGYDSGPPGASANELVRMAEAGLGAAAAIRAATEGSACALGLIDVGIVGPGRTADLLVVDGDPLEDPAILLEPERVRLVIQGRSRGRWDTVRAVPHPAVSEPRQLREGALLWQPSEAFKAASTMTDYVHWLERERGLRFADYAELWRWSVDDLAGFWSSVVDYYGIPLRGEWTEVLGDASMPGARWFDGAQLNYAEALLRRVVPDRPALLFASERRPLREVSGADLQAAVAAAAAGLRRLGVGRGDRVVAMIRTSPRRSSGCSPARASVRSGRAARRTSGRAASSIGSRRSRRGC